MKSPAEPKSQFEYSWDCPEWIYPPVQIFYEDGRYIVIEPEWLFPSDYCGKREINISRDRQREPNGSESLTDLSRDNH